MKNKTLITLIGLTLVMVVGIAGTLAWLTDRDSIVNTFTYGDIDLTLNETWTDEKGNPLDEDGELLPEGKDPVKTEVGNEYEMLPGEEYLKDPAITVEAGSEACWLFVKLTEEGGATILNADGSSEVYTFDDFLEYTVASGWTLLEDNGTESVYFRLVGESNGNTAAVFNILHNDKIKVKADVSKKMLNALDDNGKLDKDNATYPKLSLTGYAIQYAGFEPKDAAGEIITSPTSDQTKAAALIAWRAIEEQNI